MSTSKKIALTILGNHRISTIELPGDLWFETMVFQVTPNDTWIEVDLDRYGTLRGAVIGHASMVSKWRKELNIKDDIEYCYQCGEPAELTIEDEDIHGRIGDRPICRACRYDMFGKDED